MAFNIDARCEASMRSRLLLCSLAVFAIACSDPSPTKGGEPSGSTTRDAAVDGASNDGAIDFRDADVTDADPEALGPVDGSSDDSGADAARPQECDDQPVSLSPADQFVLIIDGSASMQDPFGSTATSRWQAVREALFGEDGAATAFDDPNRIALAIFGTSPRCPLPLGLSASTNGGLEALEAAFPPSPPGLFTPIAEAIGEVAHRFSANAADTTLVLITDGDPNGCDFVPTSAMPSPTITWPQTHLAIRDAVDAGFLVRVVGMDGIANAGELQRAANIGAGLDADASPGVPVGVGMDADGLRGAITDALQARSVCRLHVDAALDPAHVCEGALELEGAELECATADGWRLESPHRIVLEGAACATVAANPSAALTASLPCAAIDLPAHQCRSAADCGPVLPQCDGDVCVECTSAEHCLPGEVCRDDACSSPCGDCTGDARLCDEESSECVGCLSDANCSGTGVCDPDTRVCTGCRNNDDCLNPTPVCDTDTRRCVACQSPSECGAGEDCCNGGCVSVQGSDRYNCGGCGIVCEQDSDRCMAGTCMCGSMPPCIAPTICAALFGFPPSCL